MTKNNVRELELYIHIPFCVQKCKYCDFLSAPATKQVQNAYMEALLTEIREADVPGDRDVKKDTVVSVFIGGGTPSAVEPEWITKVLNTARKRFVFGENVEITMEMNPGTVTPESLLEYRRAGVNRLSIGCQSTKDEELKRIGRIHDYRQFLDTYNAVREAGFENVNVDLMSALPNQSMKEWEENLRTILALQPQPEHISAYSLIVEEGTPFYSMFEKGELLLPDEDEEREMYWLADRILQEAGYEHYEISNYAKAGYECRHNCGYWTRRNYLGFGIGAASLYDNIRFRNSDSLQAYLNEPTGLREDLQELSLYEQMEETMFLGLRMLEGVSAEAFEEQYGVNVDEIYRRQIEESIGEGLLECCDNQIFLTAKGLDLSNYVMAKFLDEPL